MLNEMRVKVVSQEARPTDILMEGVWGWNHRQCDVNEVDMVGLPGACFCAAARYFPLSLLLL